MSKQANLHKARSAKNDEFYTRIEDIEGELRHYRKHFKNKVVFLNCDDPEWSNFWKFFELNFEFLGLKKLISTHFERDKPSYKLEISGDVNGDGKVNGLDMIKTPLEQNGDFRSPECIELLKEADVVVTNPPFSLFREYVSLLVEHKKKFLIVGNNNAITYKEIFPLIQANKLWLGVNSNKTMEFRLPDSYQKWSRVDEDGNKYGRVPAISWFTNLKHRKRNEELILVREYTQEEYPEYDNYHAINVDRTKDVPADYMGPVGVPITFLNVHNPSQFEILDANDFRKPHFTKVKPHGLIKDADGAVNGKTKYARILIRRKTN